MKEIQVPEQPSTGDSIIITKPEIEAAFPGGGPGWRNFLVRNVNSIVATDNGAPYGKYTVIIQFVVDKKGVISDIKALTNHGYGMEQEIIKALKKSPNWEPAIFNGKQVKAYRKQPVTFVVARE